MHRLNLICGRVAVNEHLVRQKWQRCVFSRFLNCLPGDLVRLFICLDIFSSVCVCVCVCFFSRSTVMWIIFCIFTSHLNKKDTHCKSSKLKCLFHFFSLQKLLDVTQTHLAITANRIEWITFRTHFIASALTLNSLRAIIYAEFNWPGRFSSFIHSVFIFPSAGSIYSSYDYDISVLIYVIFT